MIIVIKRHISIRLEAHTFDFLDDIAKTNGLSRSNAVALAIDIVQDYFSMNQITTEHEVRGIVDGRYTKAG